MNPRVKIESILAPKTRCALVARKRLFFFVNQLVFLQENLLPKPFRTSLALKRLFREMKAFVNDELIPRRSPEFAFPALKLPVFVVNFRVFGQLVFRLETQIAKLAFKRLLRGMGGFVTR